MYKFHSLTSLGPEGSAEIEGEARGFRHYPKDLAKVITKTSPCNIQIFSKVVKIENFQ